jgi:hypothetical protein
MFIVFLSALLAGLGIYTLQWFKVLLLINLVRVNAIFSNIFLVKGCGYYWV